MVNVPIVSSWGRITELRARRFDTFGFAFGTNEREDEKGMLESASALNKLITAEVNAGIDANRIVLVGFGEGGSSIRRVLNYIDLIDQGRCHDSSNRANERT